jgi:hypothetical protein
MTILFNEAGSDADTVIEELILEHSAPKQLEVVSGDRRLQKAIKRRKGIAVESEDFARMLRERESVVPGSSQDVVPSAESGGKSDNAAPSKSDTEYWLEVFGEVDVSEAPTEPLRPEKPGGQAQASDWNAHVEKLIDDLNGADSPED